MTEIPEELVEEIAEKIIRNYIFYADVRVRDPDRHFAKGLITLILSAVREGKL